MSSSIKRAALEALQAFLAPYVSPVPVLVPQQDFEVGMSYPSVALIPKLFTYNDFQDEEKDDQTFSDSVLVDVGAFEGQVEVRVASLSAFDRERIQDLVWGAFHSDEYRKGVIVAQTAPLDIGGKAYLFPATTVMALNDEDWREEMVFASERYAYLTCDCAYPALVSRNAYTIEHLRVAFTEDLTSDNPAIVEGREINQDGSTVNV